MDLSTMALIVAILTFLFTLVGFAIKVFTGLPAEQALYNLMHSRTPTDSKGINPPPPRTPSAQPGETQPELTQKRAWRRLISHPWLLGMSLLDIPLAIGVTSPSNILSYAFLVLFLFILPVSLISSLIIAA